MPGRSDDWPVITKDKPAPLPIDLARLDAGLSQAALEAALAAVEPLVMQAGGRRSAALQMALVGGDLAVRVAVLDARIKSEQAEWSGANVDFYIASEDAKLVRQVVFALAGEGPVASADVYEMGKAKGAVELPLGLVALSQPHGYILTARIPLSAFGLPESAPQFRFESAVNVTTRPDRSRIWQSLFGSLGAFKNSSRFRLMRQNSP
jgi:hypothetical protein